MISVGWSSFPEQWIRKWVFFKVDSGTALWNGLNICIRTWWWTDAEWNYDLVHDVAKVGKCSLGDNARKRCSKAVRNHSALSLANIENLHHVANLKKITIIPNAFSGRRCAVASFGEVDGKRWQSNDRGSMSNPLPGIHAHTNPSIPQHRQKIRKRSRDNYVMPRWWLPQVQTLRRGKTGFGRWRWR